MSPTRRPRRSGSPEELLPVSRSRIRLAQGSFYLLTGLWPVLGIRSFQRVTGPKTDLWLVKTVGLLSAVIGSVLLMPSRGDGARERALLGMGSAAALAGIDAVYLAKGVLAPTYLLDAAAQFAFLAGWTLKRPPSL